MGLLAFFRDRGLDVPNVALLLYLFSPKETTKGFLYFSRHLEAPLVISDLPSSHRSWKGRYFFVSGRNWEYHLSDKDDTLGIPVVWTTPYNLREYPLCFRYNVRRMLNITDFALSSCFLGARLDLSTEDNTVALALAECPARPYAELIKSGVPSPSNLRYARSTASRPLPFSTMGVSPIGLSTATPTRGEILVQLGALSRKPRSVKRKSPGSTEKDRPVLAKVQKLVASPASFALKPERAQSTVAEAPMVASSPPPSKSVAEVKSLLGGAVE